MFRLPCRVVAVLGSWGLPCALLLGLASELHAQSPATQSMMQRVIGSAVEEVDPKMHAPIEDAILAFQLGNGEGALSSLKQAVVKDPRLSPAEVMLARMFFAANQPAQGQSALEGAVVSDPDHPEAYILMADIAIRRGMVTGAEMMFQKGLALCSGIDRNPAYQMKMQVASHAGLATVAEHRGKWDVAEAHLRKWIELEKENVHAWTRLANVFFRTRRYDDAQKTFERVRTIDSKQLLAEVRMGQLHSLVGNKNEAKAHMDAAVKKAPQDASVLEVAAAWALNSGLIPEAERHAKAALAIDKSLQNSKLVLAAVARYRNDYVQAENLFRQVLQASPSNFAASNGLAVALSEQEDITKREQALEYAQVNLRSHGQQDDRQAHEATVTFAWVLHRLNRGDEAERTLAVLLNGRNINISAEGAYLAARVLHDRKQFDAAKQLVKLSLGTEATFAHSADAKKLLTTLEQATASPPKE